MEEKVFQYVEQKQEYQVSKATSGQRGCEPFCLTWDSFLSRPPLLEYRLRAQIMQNWWPYGIFKTKADVCS